MNLSKVAVLLCTKPLCLISESCLHWFVTYRYNNLDNLGISSLDTDNCITENNSAIEAIFVPDMIVLKVDGSFRISAEAFLKLEENQSM